MRDEPNRPPSVRPTATPVIVKATVEQPRRSAFASGFHGTLGVLLALFLIFVAAPAVILFGLFVARQIWIGCEQRAWQRELQQNKIAAEQALIRQQEADIRQREAEDERRAQAKRERLQKAQPRKWHDAHGMLLYEGACIDCTETTVTIRLSVTEVAAVQIPSLSAEDIVYVKSILYGNDKVNSSE